MDKRDTLTEGEQKEIRQYIRDKIAGKKLNLNRLPGWLAKLEAENAQLRAALELAKQEIDMLHLAMYRREDVNEIINSSEYKEFMAWCEDNKGEKL